jgi:hypothetical protein
VIRHTGRCDVVGVVVDDEDGVEAEAPRDVRAEEDQRAVRQVAQLGRPP